MYASWTAPQGAEGTGDPRGFLRRELEAWAFPEEERLQRKLRSLELRVPPEVPRRGTWTATSVL